MKKLLPRLLKPIALMKMMGILMLFFGTISNSYADCTISSTVNASAFLGTYGSCSGTLTIASGGKLVIDAPLTIPSTIDVIHIEDGGQIAWTTNNTLYLAENAAIIIDNTSIISGPTSALYGTPCNNNKRINIGTVEYTACTGGGNVCIIFEEVVAAGGTIYLNPELIDIGALDSTVCDEPFPLNVKLSGFQYGDPTITWKQISGPTGGTSSFYPNNTVADPIVTVSTPGTYIYEVSVTLTLSDNCTDQTITVKKEVTVVVLESPSAAIDISGELNGTIEVCEGDDPPIITFTNNEDEDIYISYNINDGDTIINVPVAAGDSWSTSAPTDTPGTFNYNLLSISYQNGPGCDENATGTVIVIVNALPHVVAEISGTACENYNEITLNETGEDATSWLWKSNGSANFDNNTLQSPKVTNFVSGEIFTVIGTNDNGCVDSSQVTLNLVVCCTLDSAYLTVSDSIDCYDGTATVVLTAVGGNTPLTFIFGNDTIVSSNNSETFSNISAGNYNWKVMESGSGCFTCNRKC
jgi:hypothetical protein